MKVVEAGPAKLDVVDRAEGDPTSGLNRQQGQTLEKPLTGVAHVAVVVKVLGRDLKQELKRISKTSNNTHFT